MKKLLLTGYGPFADHLSNPSQDIVLELNSKEHAGFEIVGKILPVSYQKSGLMMIQHIQEEKPDAIIMLGLASSRTLITPELIAINYQHSVIPDNDGIIIEDTKIISNGESAYFTTLPIHKIIKKLKSKNISCELSTTAGSYICNLTKYYTLDHLNKNMLNIPAGFIHVPNCLNTTTLVKAIKYSIECI